MLSKMPGKFQTGTGEEFGKELGSLGHFRFGSVGTDWAWQLFPKGSEEEPGNLGCCCPRELSVAASLLA